MIPDRLVFGEQRAAAHDLVAAGIDNAAPVEALAVDRRGGGRHGFAARQQARTGSDVAGFDHRLHVGTQRLRQSHRAIDVEEPGTLLQQVGVRDRLGRVLQDRLDERWRETGVGLQHQRHRPRHGWCGDRGAAHQHLRLVQLLRDAQRCHQQAVEGGGKQIPGQCVVRRRGSADDLVARRDQIRLQQVIGLANTCGIDIPTAGRAARAEEVDAVVDARNGVVGIGGANRNHRWIIAWRADLAVVFLSQQVLAEVAGRDHHRDARSRRAAHRNAQRVGLPGLGRIGGKAQVHHADVVFLGVVDHPLDALDRVAHRAESGAVQHFHVVDVGVWCDAGGIRRGCAIELGATGCNRGDVRTVAVGILIGAVVVGNRVLVIAERIAARNQRAGAARGRYPVGRIGVEHVHIAFDAVTGARIGECPVLAHHAGVEHGDADAGTVDAAVAGLGAVGPDVVGERAGDGFERA